MHYQPKGCAGCLDRFEDCSHLDFEQMPVIEQRDDVQVVRCVYYTKATVENLRQWMEQEGYGVP